LSVIPIGILVMVGRCQSGFLGGVAGCTGRTFGGSFRESPFMEKASLYHRL
jgi:hypothetical protein